MRFTSTVKWRKLNPSVKTAGALLTVKRVQGLSYLTIFTARRKQSRIPSKSLDLRTGKASLHVSKHNHCEVILSFITFA